MADIGRASGRFDIELHQDTEGLQGVNFRLLEAHEHQGLGFQLISERADLPRIEVELRALRWSPEPPTTDSYTTAARAMVSPMLAAYNRIHSTRYRLRIQKGTRRAFRLSARTAFLIDRFATLANTTSLHPRDWERFYQLVYMSRQKIPETHLRSMLVRNGFSPEKAERLTDLYTHLWAFKRLRP
jgi:hypothetical protein